MDNKPLPQNLEAELSVLGSILIDNNSIDNVIEIITADDFYNTKHKYIFTKMMDLYTKARGIDEITLAEIMGKEGLQSVGGYTFLMQIKESCPTAKNVIAYAKILKEASNKRQAIKALNEAMYKIYEEDSLKVLNALSDKLVTIGSKENKIISAAELMEITLSKIEERFQSGGKIPGMSTGIDRLDKYTNGIRKGEVTIIAARPSMGKTCFILNLMHNMSKEHGVVMYQLEMNDEEVGNRMLSAESFTEGDKLQQGRIADNEWSKLMDGAARLTNHKFWIDTQASQSIDEIRAKTKKMKMQHNIDAIVIDHLGLIEMSGEDRNNEIAKITRAGKIMAKELDIAVIFLSQLSRACEQRADHRPMLSDLRDSGSIEQDADLVIMLYRDAYYNKETEDKNIIEAILTKNRNGRVGRVKLNYIGEFQLITGLDFNED